MLECFSPFKKKIVKYLNNGFNVSSLCQAPARCCLCPRTSSCPDRCNYQRQSHREMSFRQGSISILEISLWYILAECHSCLFQNWIQIVTIYVDQFGSSFSFFATPLPKQSFVRVYHSSTFFFTEAEVLLYHTILGPRKVLGMN